MSETAATNSNALPKCPLWARVIATGFGSGLSPYAPGTIGSLAALVLLVVIAKVFDSISLTIQASGNYHLSETLGSTIQYFPLGFFVIYCIIGVPASGMYAISKGLKDPKQVVIDEFAGQTLAVIPVSLFYFQYSGVGVLCMSGADLLLAFLLFRLFDIWKPWPIRRLEHLPGGWGIMLDDIAAGLVAGVLLLIMRRYLWEWIPAGCYF